MDKQNLEACINDIDGLDKTSVPPWALVMMNSLKGLFEVLKGYDALEKRIEQLESFKEISENTTSFLVTDSLLEKVKMLEQKIDDHEQRSRNQCLLIHGIEEKDKEDTDVLAVQVATELDISITVDDIARSHRLGPKKTIRETRQNRIEKPRPIIVRFCSYRIRQTVFQSKKKLKGKPISITENLTKSRMMLYKKVLAKFGKGNCWTVEGRIFVKRKDGNVVINSVDDIE